jgi:hypothetical protein
VLLTKAFAEMRRVLKPTGKATVIFHSTQAEVWQALVSAYSAAGFSVVLSSILDKRQGSFKQVSTRNFAKGDPMILLSPQQGARELRHHDLDAVIESLLSQARSLNDPQERTPHRLYSRFVTHYLRRQSPPPVDADEFYSKLKQEDLSR